MKLSIIIPVYNEEKTVTEIVSKVKSVKLPNNISKEIIIVNDASTDSTAKLLSHIKGVTILKHSVNRGKGAAIRTGLQKSKGDILLIQDADLEYDPNDFNRLLAPIVNGVTKVVYGTRLKNFPLRITGQRRTPLITHYLGNKFLSLLTSILYGRSVTDMETCYKVFKTEVIKDMKIHADRFDFEPEITAKILKRGFLIYEIPIKVKPRGYNEGKKISWRDGFKAVWTLLKYRFID